MCLSKALAKDIMRKLSSFFESTIDIPKIKYGSSQTIEILINEEALLFTSYLGNERENWIPKVGIPN